MDITRVLTLGRKAFALALFTTLAGCAGAAIQRTVYAPGYSTGEHIAASGGGKLPVVILGNPFPTSKGALESVVTESLQAGYAGPPVKFTPVTLKESDSYYRIVIRLSAPPALEPPLVCKDRAEIPRETASKGTVTFTAALCRGSQYRSAVNGYVTGISDPDESKFKNAMEQVAHALFR